jgi:hypothetical protein
MRDRDDLNLVSNHAKHDRVGKPVEDEAPTDVALDERKVFGLRRDAFDAFFDGCLEQFGGHWVASAVPEECFSGLGFGTLLDPELPTRHGLLAGENALARVVPIRELGAARVDVGYALPDFVAPRALDVGWRLAHAVQELESKDRALFGRKRLGFFEELIRTL